ncbi:unnamed protein product [Rotaria sordida]|uniref:DED domain-containing protein n=1 Tax=Rotaria sordida TaxID=392033 RepID=A0A819HV00_9BILA|nr:unnamed protein product [Rotaria sordida]
MDSLRLRGIIVKLQDRLSNDDRKRLHFYLGNDVPRRIRDDASLSGTLSLMDSLFDQDKINEKDFTFLINAFNEIQCIDAVKLLREHLRQIQSNGLNQSIESLSMIMPPMINQLLQDQDEDKYAVNHFLVNQENTCDTNNIMINSDNTNINQMPMIICDKKAWHSEHKRNQISNSIMLYWKYLFIFILLSIIGYGILFFLSVKNIIDINQLKVSNKKSIEKIQQLEISNNQSIEIIQQLIHQMKHFIKKARPLRSSAIDIHPNAKWIQNGHTVAGGNRFGNRTNQLYNPCGLYVDDDQTIYVADQLNHRIVEWKQGATSGQVIAGGNRQGNGDHQLSILSDVIVDKEKDSLIICDNSNRRVVRWPRRNGTTGETIISNIMCVGLTMDENGSLYVIDFEKDEVRQYRREESQGTLIAGGNGNGNRLNQLSYPQYIFIDRDHSVYVSEYGNHRVMKWLEGAKQGIVVAGGQGKGNGLTQLSYPRGVIVDQFGTVYVADDGNDRIMRWIKGATQGDVIIGGKGEGEESNQLNGPVGLSFDRYGNLYVVDNENHRVQKFNIDSNA